MQKFFTNTLISDYIKNVLANTPLPVIDTVSDGDIIIKNCDYIHKNKVIRCTESGALNETPSIITEFFNSTPAKLSKDNICEIKTVKIKPSNQWIEILPDLSPGTSIMAGRYKLINGYIEIAPNVNFDVQVIYSYTNYKKAKYTKISGYQFGQYYPKLTEKFISKYNYYDSDTHYYLGQYLKCIRDLYDLDLMPFYNCFSYKTIKGFHLNVEGVVKSKDDTVKLLAVPIRFNKPYTIAIDSNSQVLLKSVFYNNLGIKKATKAFSIQESLADYNISGETTISKSSTSFKHPFIYQISNLTDDDELNELYQRNEKYLYLIIQIANTNNSSLVVLEGDYTLYNQASVDGNDFHIVSSEGELTNKQANTMFLSKLSLLKINDNNIYPFSNRLIEYLLHNVITDRDELGLDIGRIQYVVTNNTTTKGIWNNDIRQNSFNRVIDNKNNEIYDTNGFIDKTSEKILCSGVDYTSDDFINWAGKLRS